METLYTYYMNHIDLLPSDLLSLLNKGEAKERIVCDFVGAMSDRYAIAKYDELFIPKSWHI